MVIFYYIWTVAQNNSCEGVAITVLTINALKFAHVTLTDNVSLVLLFENPTRSFCTQNPNPNLMEHWVHLFFSLLKYHTKLYLIYLNRAQEFAHE